MILCSITATCLTYFDCMDHKNAAWGVDNANVIINSRSQSPYAINITHDYDSLRFIRHFVNH